MFKNNTTAFITHIISQLVITSFYMQFAYWRQLGFHVDRNLTPSDLLAGIVYTLPSSYAIGIGLMLILYSIYICYHKSPIKKWMHTKFSPKGKIEIWPLVAIGAFALGLLAIEYNDIYLLMLIFLPFAAVVVEVKTGRITKDYFLGIILFIWWLLPIYGAQTEKVAKNIKENVSYRILSTIHIEGLSESFRKKNPKFKYLGTINGELIFSTIDMKERYSFTRDKITLFSYKWEGSKHKKP